MGERTVWGLGRPTGADREGVALRGPPAVADCELPVELRFLAEAGMARSTLLRATEFALRHDLPADAALVAIGAITRDIYDEALAEHLGVAWRPEGPPLHDDGNSEPVLDRNGVLPDLPLIAGEGALKRLHVDVSTAGAAKLLRMLRHRAHVESLLALSPRLKIRRAAGSRGRKALARRASGELARRLPAMSASLRFSPGQAAALLAMLASLSIVFLFAGRSVWLALGLLFTAYYLGHVALRAELLRRIGDRPRNPAFRARGALPPKAPVYTVIVALYREAGQAEGLARSLQRLDWPSHRLEVLFVCEADDPATAAAIEALDLPGNFCVLRVPEGIPRTKPRALNYALNFASGEYIVVYDAEDRPGPGQLREAHEAFVTGGPTFACVQAPLEIHNGAQSWLSAMFALEYDVLFRGMLPALADMGAPLPLGGTSNHFRGIMYQTHQAF